MESVIKQFKVGDVFESYEHLCRVLSIPSTRGNTKKSNLKKISRFCNYTTDKHKFTIIEVYDMALPIPARKTNADKKIWVTDPICEVILTELKNLVDDSLDITDVFITTYSLSNIIGLCNKNFYLDRSSYAYYKKEDKDIASDDFYSIASSKIPDIVKAILSSLRRRYQIHIVETYKITRLCEGANIVDFAGNKELTYIKDARFEVMKQEPFSKLGSLELIYSSSLKSKFQREVNKILKNPPSSFLCNDKGYRFFITNKIQLRLDAINKSNERYRINKELQDYMRGKLENNLEYKNFPFRMDKDFSVIPKTKQKEMYELVFIDRINETIAIQEDKLLIEL